MAALELVTNHRRFQWLVALNSTHNGILIVDAEGIVQLYNQAAHRIFHYDRPGPLGKHMSQVRPEAWPDISRILKTGEPQVGVRIELPQTTIIANRNPIMENGEITGVISIFQDISDYEAIISQLRGYQDLYRELEAVFESSFDGLFVVNGKGNTVRLNSAYERISGLNRDQIVGRHVSELVRDKIIDRSVTMQVRRRRAPVTIMQKIQGERNMMVTGTPVFDDQGEISLVVINVRDLTVLNQLKASLEEARKLESLYQQSLKRADKHGPRNGAHGHPQRSHEKGAAKGGEGGECNQFRASLRRIRRGQEHAGPHHPRNEHPQGQALCQNQLRGPSRSRSWKANCSAMRRGPSPGPCPRARPGCSKRRTREPSFWTRWRS